MGLLHSQSAVLRALHEEPHPPTAFWAPSQLSPWAPWFSLVLAGDWEHSLGSDAQCGYPAGPFQTI